MTRVEANAKLHEELRKQNKIAVANNIYVANVSNFNERLMNINKKYFQEKNLEFYLTENFEKPYVGDFSRAHLLYEELKYDLTRARDNLTTIIESANKQNDDQNIYKRNDKILLNDQENIDFANTLIDARDKYFQDSQNYYEKMMNITKIYSPLDLGRIQKEMEENFLTFEEEYNSLDRNLYTLQKKVKSKPIHSNKVIYLIIFLVLFSIIILIVLGIVLFFI